MNKFQRKIDGLTIVAVSALMLGACAIGIALMLVKETAIQTFEKVQGAVRHDTAKKCETDSCPLTRPLLDSSGGLPEPERQSKQSDF